jgi:hypothetical protein
VCTQQTVRQKVKHATKIHEGAQTLTVDLYISNTIDLEFSYIPISNLGRDTQYTEAFIIFLSPSRQMLRCYINQIMSASFAMLTSFSSIITSCYIVWSTKKFIKYITKKTKINLNTRCRLVIWLVSLQKHFNCFMQRARDNYQIDQMG